MRSTSDIQFFVCRSRIIPEPPFPSQGIAGSGNEIAFWGTAFNAAFFSVAKTLIKYFLTSDLDVPAKLLGVDKDSLKEKLVR